MGKNEKMEKGLNIRIPTNDCAKGKMDFLNYRNLSFLHFFILSFFLLSCHHHHEPEPEPTDQTILYYFPWSGNAKGSAGLYSDFQNNIRSIQNVWLGNVNGVQTSVKSFHNFFASAEAQNVNTAVEGAVDTAISNIGKMPSPFVKYVCTLWNIEFTDDEDWEVEE